MEPFARLKRASLDVKRSDRDLLGDACQKENGSAPPSAPALRDRCVRLVQVHTLEAQDTDHSDRDQIERDNVVQ